MDVSHLTSWVLELSSGSPEGQQVPCGLHVIRNQSLLPQRTDGGTIDPSLAVSPDKRLDIWLEEGSNHMAHLETNEEQALGAWGPVSKPERTAVINSYWVPVSPLQCGGVSCQSVPCHIVSRDEHFSRLAEVSGGKDVHPGTGKVL